MRESLGQSAMQSPTLRVPSPFLHGAAQSLMHLTAGASPRRRLRCGSAWMARPGLPTGAFTRAMSSLPTCRIVVLGPNPILPGGKQREGAGKV